MFIKSSNEKNKKIVQLGLVTYYYPSNRGEAENSAGGIPYIVFQFDGDYVNWSYGSEEERDQDLAMLDGYLDR